MYWYGPKPANRLDKDDPAYKVLKIDNPTYASYFNIAPFLSPAAIGQYPDWATNPTSRAAAIKASNNAGPASYNVRIFPQRFDWVRNPANSQLDASLTRNIGLVGRAKLQVRLDLLNALNHPVSNGAIADLGNSNFGTGQLAQGNLARQLNFQARLMF